MKIQKIRTISGPNIFHHRPVLVMTLDLGSYADTSSADIQGFTERLTGFLPGLQEHRCSLGRPGGFIERLGRGTYFAHIIEHIALELSGPAGIEVTYGKSVYAGSHGVYNVIVRYRNEEAMKYLLQQAVELALAAAENKPFPVEERIARAKEIVEDSELGPSTRAIVSAAEKRNIPWSRLNELNLIQFGYGCKRKLIQATTSNLTSDIAVDIAQDKELSKRLLEIAAIPVPKGSLVRSEEEALEEFERFGAPVVLKPYDGHQGKGVSLNLTTREEVARAYQVAAEYSSSVVIEEFLPGKDFRMIVVGGKFVAAARREPAHVVGDGVHTVTQLIELANQDPRRGDGHEKPLTKIRIDAISQAFLEKMKIDVNSVPPEGEKIFLRGTANLSTGGTAIDVTDQVHPEIRTLAERVARVVGLDICGVDLVGEDISRPMKEQKAGIVEVNAGPGIRMHHYPAEGKPRDVGGAIVEMLYPGGEQGRIPIISVTGTNGKTTVTRMIGHAISRTGKCVGMTTSDGIFIDNRVVSAGDTTGPISAKAVLCDPGVEVAVLETARGGIARRGLGYDWSDVAVLTNIQPDHIGQDGIETVDDVLRIKALVAERVCPNGTVVLNADDERLVRLGERLLAAEPRLSVAYFSLHANNIVIHRHLAKGGMVYFVRNGKIFEGSGNLEVAVADVAEIPVTFRGTAAFQISNCLAAVAACRGFGMTWTDIADALRSFEPNAHNSGRTNLYRLGHGYVMVDYGHNPDAIQAICGMAARWHGARVTGVIAAPGDRDDEIIRDVGRAAAQGFQKVIIREDLDLRGRAEGAVAEILCETITKEKPSLECIKEPDERKAMERAIREMQEGEILVLFYDDLQIVKEILDSHAAEPVEHVQEVITRAGIILGSGQKAG